MSELARIGTHPWSWGLSNLCAIQKVFGNPHLFVAGVKEAWQTAAKPTWRHDAYRFDLGDTDEDDE